jgi:hypothetical protein
MVTAHVCSLTQALVFACYASLVHIKNLSLALVIITVGNRHLTYSLLHLILTGFGISLQLSSRTYFRSRIASHRL